MAELVERRAYYSLLRWRSNPARDEARNVAVILVDERGDLGGVKAAPLSHVSPRLHEQGLLDTVLVELDRRFQEPSRPRLDDLEGMRRELQHSLYLTEPKPIVVADPDVVLQALYRAYLAPAGRGSRKVTKGAVLDRVVTALRHRGFRLRRSQYVDGFAFDLVFESPKPILGEVLSFAAEHKNWTAVENDAGHFLYGLRRIKRPGLAVVQPPADHSSQGAVQTHGRVVGWLRDEHVQVLDPDQVTSKQFAFRF